MTAAAQQGASSARPVVSDLKGGRSGDWVLTFADEFNHFTPYNGRFGLWETKYWWGRTNSGTHEIEYYSDPTVGLSPFNVADGVLDIVAARSSANALRLPYTSGIITTFPTFSQTYGFFEMQAQLPAGKGMWPAFWLAAADKTWPPEIDIMEALGQKPHSFSVNTHSGRDGLDLRQTQHDVTVAADLTAGFHVYGADWEPDAITWYFDGIPIARAATPPDLHKPMYLIANLAVAGARNGWGPPDATTPLPAHFRIGYIRVFAHRRTAALPSHGADAAVSPDGRHGAHGAPPHHAAPFMAMSAGLLIVSLLLLALRRAGLVVRAEP